MDCRNTLRILLCSTWLLMAMMPSAAHADITGKIVGQVTDAATGAPLIGVNVMLENTRLGAATDLEGRYFIINIPAGTYRLTATIIGYSMTTVAEVLVSPDQTTSIDFALQEAAIQGETVTVTAERPLIQPDQTSTMKVLTAEELQVLPARGYKSATALQAGVVSYNGGNLAVRGGRSSETAFFVDGFSQQDPLTGQATTSINSNAIDQITVITGGFNAEYGRIMSGIVNTTTKRGGTDYHGTFEAISDFLGESFNNTYSYGYKVYNGAFGGPLFKGSDRVTFFISGEGRSIDDRFPRAGVVGQLPSNSLTSLNWQGKVNIRLKQTMDLEISSIGSTSEDEIYMHAYKYDAHHMPRREDKNRSLNGRLKHQISPRTYYELAANVFVTTREVGDGEHFDDLPGYGRPNPGRRFDEDNLFFVNDSTGEEGSIWNDYLYRKSWYTGFQGAFTSQVNRHHQVKGGFDIQRHTLRRLHHLNPLNNTPGNSNAWQPVDVYGMYAPKEGTGNAFARELDQEAKHPVTSSFYLQDKVEFEGLIINAGLRFDQLKSGTKAFRIEDLPLGTDSRLDPEDMAGAKTYNRISPRLGASFPITDRTKFHFHIGQFYQQPDLQNLFVSYEFAEFMITQAPFFFPFGNPNLKPEQTTAYEIGVAHQLGDYMAVHSSLYYKNVRNLTQLRTISRPEVSQFSYSSYQNVDFGTIRGMDLSMEMRRIRNIRASAAYSFSMATGTGSTPTSQRNIAFTSGQIPKQTAPLNFDQRHRVSFDIDLRYAKGEGGIIFGRRMMERMGLNLLFQAGSGLPYTPMRRFNEVTLANVTSEPTGPINSSRMPWTFRTDVKISRDVPLEHVDLNVYIWVLNLFNRKNALQVYQSTGLPNTTSFLITKEGQEILQAKSAEDQAAFMASFDDAENNPTYYDIPRQIRAGLQIRF